jgi:hypothetical protein
MAADVMATAANPKTASKSRFMISPVRYASAGRVRNGSPNLRMLWIT